MKIWSGKHRILMSLTFPVLLLHISSFHWISNFILPDNIFSNKNIWHLNENADIKNQESNERICPFSKIALSNADESRVPLSIPVVIYIIYDPSLQGDQSPYPTDAQILAGIDWINNLLAGGPACPGDLVSVETGIRLCLATRDIGGQPTSGILRFPNTLTDLDLCKDDLALKQIPRTGSDLFPNSDYLNLYIVREICASCQPVGCLAGGYAAYPAAHGTLYDGIVLESATWMNQDCNIRKVILHELGHYFNLRHTWEGPCTNDDCLTQGDQVCDTPPDNDENFYPSNPCIQGLPVNSCFTDVNLLDPNNPFNSDQPDMTSNLMDYAPPACIAVFTQGQADRMTKGLQGPRHSLILSKGCELPCSTPINLNIDWPSTTLIYGSPITIDNNSTGAVSYERSWYGGASQSVSFGFPADSIGTFEICVSAIGSTPECTRAECRMIEVACSLNPITFSLSDDNPNYGEEVHLQQTSAFESGYTYTWYINGQPLGQGTSISFVPELAGSNIVWLEACRSDCCQESLHTYFAVGNCPTGKEANHWFFSDDSIHLEWNGNQFVELGPSGGRAYEATAVANDANGQLLFYTNTEYIYNRLDQPMPNGNFVFNAFSSTQALTVPLPGSDSLWYVFIPQSENGLIQYDTITKLLMSIVDMSLDGEKGDVILKNQIILQPTSEKIAATRHCNGTDWWLLGHEAGTNRFFSWLLDDTGLHLPIITSIGISKPNDRITKGGELNFSPDGLKIAMSTGPSYVISHDTNWTVEIFDFDPSTGLVSNSQILGNFRSANPTSLTYGLEFSPSSQYLYVACGAWIDTLMQFDVTLPLTSQIRNSRKDIYVANDPKADNLTALLTGPDGKIYVGNYLKPYLGIIENPNDPPEKVVFNNMGFIIPRGECWLGLPTFPSDIYTPDKPWLKGPAALCDTLKEAQYYVSGNCRYQDYEWKIIGSSKIVRTEGDTVWIKPGNAGIDQLAVIKYTACSTLYDTLQIEVQPCDTSMIIPCSIDFTWSEADTILCSGEDAWLRFYSQADHARYVLSSEGISHSLLSSTLVILHPLADEKVTIYLNSNTGCDTQIIVNIHVNPSLDAHFLSVDSLICTGAMAMINLQTPSSNLVEIFPENLGFVITDPTWPLFIGPLNSDTILYVRIRNQAMGCDSVFKWKIQVESKVKTHSDTLQFCAGDSVTVSGHWFYQDTLLAETIPLRGCDSIHSVQITSYPVLHANIEMNDPCKINNVSISIVSINGVPPFLYSLNSGLPQPIPLFNQLNAGQYLVEITDGHGCKLDTLITLKDSDALSGIDSDIINPSCNEKNGSILLHSHQPDILYALNNGVPQMDSVFTDLSEAAYSIIATNNAGCMDTIEVVLLQQGSPKIHSVEITPEHCNLSDGTLTVDSVSNGLKPYSFQLGNTTAQLSTSFPGLASGQYMVFVEDANGCRDTITSLIPEEEAPVINSINIIPAYCNAPEGILEVEAQSQSPLKYSLDQFTSADGQFTQLISGSYVLSVEDTFGCKTSTDIMIPDSMSFSIVSIKTLDAGCNTEGGRIEIITSGTEVKIMIEELPGQDFNSPIENLTAGTYHLRLKDAYNCIIDTLVTISSECNISLPNVFSPNGDQINDVFGALPELQFTSWKLSIFDRSGNMVFHSNDPTAGWNGNHHNKPAQSGVYAWMIEYRLVGNDMVQVMKGDVTLLR